MRNREDFAVNAVKNCPSFVLAAASKISLKMVFVAGVVVI
jgi:hypothetical protein